MNINLEIKKLESKMQDILDRCEHWKSCQDGSYNMALHSSGYYECRDKLNQLERGEN